MSATAASWADRVRSGIPQADMPAGNQQPPAGASFKPGKKKEFSCPCSGILLVMLGNYGWIEADRDIDHPEAGRNAGRVFVHATDMSPQCFAGNRVKFYLYADDQGLGAEACEVEDAPPPSADAESFPALAPQGPVDATRGKRSVKRMEKPHMRACAPEFVPAEVNPVEALNSSSWQLTAEEEIYESRGMQRRVNMCEIIDELFSDGSDDEEEPVLSAALLKLKASAASASVSAKADVEDFSSNKSTESGEEESSLGNVEEDSGDESNLVITPPPGLEGWRSGTSCQGFRPPPGLPEPQAVFASDLQGPTVPVPPWRRAACCQ